MVNLQTLNPEVIFFFTTGFQFILMYDIIHIFTNNYLYYYATNTSLRMH